MAKTGRPKGIKNKARLIWCVKYIDIGHDPDMQGLLGLPVTYDTVDVQLFFDVHADAVKFQKKLIAAIEQQPGGMEDGNIWYHNGDIIEIAFSNTQELCKQLNNLNNGKECTTL